VKPNQNTLVNIASELPFGAGFAVAGAKALIIQAGNGTTKVVP
jgi:pantoate kinase